MSMIVRTPRPSSPTSQASAPSSSISLDAFDRLPSLSFSRWMPDPRLRSPSGSQRGTRKHDSPPGAWASIRNTSRHRRRAEPLVPGEAPTYAVASSAPATRSARVVLARTSEPPCFSVMPMPARAPGFSRAAHVARVVGPGDQPRLPLGGQVGDWAAARGRPSRSSRSGSRGRRRPGTRRRTRRPGPRGRRRRSTAHGAAVQAVAPPRPASARGRRGGTRPRRSGGRSGRGCAARAGSGWRRTPSAMRLG